MGAERGKSAAGLLLYGRKLGRWRWDMAVAGGAPLLKVVPGSKAGRTVLGGVPRREIRSVRGRIVSGSGGRRRMLVYVRQ